MGFSQPLSGLAAQSKNLDVISNNIANSQTVGFKGGSALFADVFAGANSQVGLGVRVSDIRQDFNSGDVESTGRGLDLAITGDGFFRLEQPSGEAVFSRNGQFTQDSEGFIVNATGQKLTGFGLSDPNDPLSPIAAGGEPKALQVPRGDVPAQATGEVNGVYNLNAAVTVGNDLQSATVKDAAGGNDQELKYHYSSSFTVFDSLGNDHVATQYFRKSSDDLNTWDVHTALDGVIKDYNAGGSLTDDGAPDNSSTTGNYGETYFQVSFDNDGTLSDDGVKTLKFNDTDPGSGIPSIFDGPDKTGATFGTQGDSAKLEFVSSDYGFGGAADLSFDFNLAGTTQFNKSSVQTSLSQDGFTSGSLAGIEVVEDGTVQRNYTNGETRAAGQIALGSFVNTEGLQPDGDNNFRATRASGPAAIGTPGTGLLGGVEAGAVENSNVDLATELVDTIVAQRAYQANSTSISTQDELLQTVIQLG